MESGKSGSFRDGAPVRLPSAAAGLRDALRAATADVHERLHCHDGLAAVQAGTIDREAYQQLLSRLYGFYRPFEAAAQLSPERTRWLEVDLDALGVCATLRDTLPRCTAFPPRFSPDHVLGARYVVEGSALGGRGMAVSWKGQEQGCVSTEKSDRNYTVAVRPSGHSMTCDTLGEAVLYLVPELLEVPCTFFVKHFPTNPVGQRWAIRSMSPAPSGARCWGLKA